MHFILNMSMNNATQYAEKRKGQQHIDTQLILRHKLETIKGLTGVISHEFNNLLMCIQGETSLLLYKTPKDDPRYLRMKQIERHIEKGARLSNWACGFPVALQSLRRCPDLDRLVKDSIDKFSGLTEIVFQIESASCLLPVNIDERHIRTALKNIYSFFLAGKGGIIDIRCENRTLDSYGRELTGLKMDRYVTISVRDKKRYLAEGELLEVFTPGINLAKNTESNIPAMLITAYWIIDKNMGRLVVTSEKEKGTEFSIYLPAESEDHSLYPPGT